LVEDWSSGSVKKRKMSGITVGEGADQ